jgi:hypothetical protein
MALSLKQQLDQTRDGYDEESTWLRFLLDAYTGGGGFQGRIKQPPAGFWGAVAESFSSLLALATHSDVQGMGGSYLDQYKREDADKYARRVAVSHYLNYVRPTTNLKISYIIRKPHKRNNVPPALQDWIDRTGYDKDFRRRALVTAVLGWFPMLVDMPEVPKAARTQADAGTREPYTVLCLPCHLRDYQLDEQGEFLWAKMAQSFQRKDAWDSEAVTVTRYTIWTRDEFTVYEAVGDQVTEQPRTGRHTFGRVPVVAWRSDTAVEDPIRADSINADIAHEVRRLFNLISELDEHIRSQVFALLVVPGGTPPAGGAELGVENGLVIDREQKNVPFFLAPPGSVAATLEARIVATVVEIYRLARVEYTRPSGTNSSAQSKEREFSPTNLSIADLASSLAAGDRETLITVGRGLSIAEETLQQLECVAHESYADEALDQELEQAVEALTIRELGAQFRVELLKRLAQKLLPSMSTETRKVIESEIEEQVKQAEREAVAAAENLPNGGDDEPPPEGDPQQDGDEEERQAAE